MDSLITAAARSLGGGDPLAALKFVALREDPPALALRGIAMAQLGDLTRAKLLLRKARRAFGPKEQLARARCLLAEAEIAFITRDLSGAMELLDGTRATLKACGDSRNVAHAGILMARRQLLLGQLEDSERLLNSIEIETLPGTSVVAYWLVAAGIASRRIQASRASEALDIARLAAKEAGIAALMAEVERASCAVDMPAARLIEGERERMLSLADVENLIGSDALVIDACRNVVSQRARIVSLKSRPVLFALARALGEAWPADVSREQLLVRAFRARHANESHRARLRVEIGRLRKALGTLAGIRATQRGFVLETAGGRKVAAIAPPHEHRHGGMLALLTDGEAWSSSALALALGVSSRTVQRALYSLAADGKVEPFGRGRARRWIAKQAPGFPTSLLLAGSAASG